MEELIKKWKEYNLDRAEFEFVASGDSMGDTALYFYSKEDKEVTVDEDFKQKIEDHIYASCEFYEVSDGHYQGESGTVTVTLIKEEDEEPILQCSKDAQAEYINSYNDTLTVELTKEEYDFVNKFIEDVGDNVEFHYKKDFFMSPIRKELIDSITEKMRIECENHEFDYNGDGEIQDLDEYYMSNLEVLEDNKISFSLTYNVTEYESSDW